MIIFPCSPKALRSPQRKASDDLCLFGLLKLSTEWSLFSFFFVQRWVSALCPVPQLLSGVKIAILVEVVADALICELLASRPTSK